jgi:glycosyltransferase involved in cell wall biosynthesis
MICSEFPPKCAGIGISAFGLSKALVKRGHNVTVLTRGNFFNEKRRNLNGINVIELPFIAFPPPFHLIYHGYFLNRKINELKDHFDIFHLHTPLIPNIHTKMPKIVSVHSLWMEETNHYSDGMDVFSLAIKLFKKQIVNSEISTLKQADIIVTYPHYKNKLLKLYKILSTPITTTNGLIISNSDLTNIPKKVYDVIFVGRLNPCKGIKEIIKVAEIILKNKPKVKFLIIGDGPSKKGMITELNKLGLKQNFTFLGFVQNTKLSKYFLQSSISLMPSRYETFGIVTGEAMACRLPVVGTKTDGSKRLIKNGVTGYLVNIGDYTSLANKIISLLQNKKVRLQMGYEGRKRITKYFSTETSAKQYESIYKTTLRSYENK